MGLRQYWSPLDDPIYWSFLNNCMVVVRDRELREVRACIVRLKGFAKNRFEGWSPLVGDPGPGALAAGAGYSVAWTHTPK